MNRALTILNETGDVTIIWDEAADERMLEIIEKKMAAGINFFMIEHRMGGLFAPDTSKQVAYSREALKYRALSMRDADFEGMVTAGAAALVATPSAPARTVRRARTAREVVSGESVGVQQMRGGWCSISDRRCRRGPNTSSTPRWTATR